MSVSAPPASRSGLAPELRAAIGHCRMALMGAGLFSGLINLLALSSSIYMLQVYDRVLPSHSVPTLVGLSIAMLLLFAAYGLLDVVRTRLMGRIGVRIDRTLRERVGRLVMQLPLKAGPGHDAMQPVRDLDQIRSFLAGAGPVALFDLPWLPFYLALVYLLHPLLGLLATAGALVLVGITVMTEFRGREPARGTAVSGANRLSIAEAARRNAAAIRSMGMTERVVRRWADADERHLVEHTKASDIVGTYGAISKVLRLTLQSAVLGLGAYLVIEGQATAGVMIAASILVSRALAPIEIAIANWRGFIAARQSSSRLSRLLAALPERKATLDLPAPARALEIQALTVAAPGRTQPIIQNVSFALEAGEGLGIIGPSAAGKSTLVRALIGAWPPLRGSVRLDGAALDQWDPDRLGRHIGYLPQETELFAGTVAQNIARFDPDATPEAVIEAATVAGVHELAVRLADGYDTEIGEGGLGLSAGQRQRVALARALYGNPFLVVLDEPNSNLDGEGETALDGAIKSVRARGGIVIVVAHRRSALEGVDKLMVMAGGQVQLLGPKDEVQQKLGVNASGAAHAPAAAEAAQSSARASTDAMVRRPAARADGSARLVIVTDEPAHAKMPGDAQ